MSDKRETGLKFTINLKTGRITEKRDRDTASFTNEEAAKKMKHDISSSSGSDSNAKQGDGSEEAVSVPTANVMDDIWSPISTEDKPRNQDDTDSSSGSVPASLHDQDSQTKKTCSPSSSSAPSASCSGKDQQPSGSNQRTLLYKKSLTNDDVSFCRLKIPLESGRKFLPEPKKYNGVYEKIRVSFVDHEGHVWGMEAAFEEPGSSYILWLNWDRYLKIFGVEAADVIFFYDVPGSEHHLIQYEKKGRDSNPKDTT